MHTYRQEDTQHAHSLSGRVGEVTSVNLLDMWQFSHVIGSFGVLLLHAQGAEEHCIEVLV